MIFNFELDDKVKHNFSKVKLWFLIPSVLLLILFFFYFWFSKGINFINKYVDCQSELFYFLNGKLSDYPTLEFNLTQLGDASILYPFLIVFLFYAPKFWEALLASSLITLLVSAALKKVFAIPRPSTMLDNDCFVIIGKAITSPNSLPSGHSMTIFMVITIFLFAFIPKKTSFKIVWLLLILVFGLFIAFSRVGVGAHYPIDVIIGSTIGYIAAIIGIKLSNNKSWLNWIKNKKFYPVFMLLIAIWILIIIKKIVAINLLIFYLSIIPLVVILFIITKVYVKKN